MYYHSNKNTSKQLSETLKRHEVSLKKKGLAFGLGDKLEYVFTNTEGKLLNPDNWRYWIFKKTLEKAKLRAVTIHPTRHSYATIRIVKGYNFSDVSNQLGHHSIQFTLDRYAHWIPGKKKVKVDALYDSGFTALKNAL